MYVCMYICVYKCMHVSLLSVKVNHNMCFPEIGTKDNSHLGGYD